MARQPTINEQGVALFLKALKIAPGASPQILRLMREARVFTFTQEMYLAAYRRSDIYTTEEIAGNTFHPPVSEGFDRMPEPSFQDSMEGWGSIHDAGTKMPFIHDLPFNSVFYAIAGGVRIQPMHAQLRGFDHANFTVSLIGYLLNFQGHAFEVLEGLPHMKVTKMTDGVPRRVWVHDKTKAKFVAFVPLRKDNQWKGAAITLAPWIITLLTHVIREHKTILEQNPSRLKKRGVWNRSRRLAGFLEYRGVPKPYYEVRLKTNYFKERVNDLTQHLCQRGYHRSPGHRFDVQGHERLRLYRGQNPIDPKFQVNLEQRGYRITTEGPLTIEDDLRFCQRGIPNRQADEWFAIRVTWVDAYIKGDVKLPYVPSARTLDPAVVDEVIGVSAP